MRWPQGVVHGVIRSLAEDDRASTILLQKSAVSGRWSHGLAQDRRNLPNQMIVRHDRIEVERIDELPLVLNAPSYHRMAPSMPASQRRNHGSRGPISTTLAGMALGGWLAGAIYDWTGSYAAALINGIGWNIVNMAIVIWLLQQTLGRAGGVDAQGEAVLRRQLRRARVLPFFQKLPPCLAGIEACASSHYWEKTEHGLTKMRRKLNPSKALV